MPYLFAGLFNNPVTNWNDQAVFFGKFYELKGRQQATLGVIPADQRLGTNNFPRLHILFRLEIKLPLFMFYRFAQVLIQFQVFSRQILHMLVIELII